MIFSFCWWSRIRRRRPSSKLLIGLSLSLVSGQRYLFLCTHVVYLLGLLVVCCGSIPHIPIRSPSPVFTHKCNVEYDERSFLVSLSYADDDINLMTERVDGWYVIALLVCVSTGSQFHARLAETQPFPEISDRARVWVIIKEVFER